METYQAIYDAVRSKIQGGSVTDAIEQAFRDSGLSHYTQQASSRFIEEISDVASEHTRPSVLMRPKIYIDGDEWCALYGENLQDGVAGFGISPQKAMSDFDREWRSDKQALAPTKETI